MSDVGVFPMLTVEAVTRRGPPTRYSILRRLTILTETMKRPNLHQDLVIFVFKVFGA